MADLDKLRGYAPIVLRVGVSILFLWFGFSQIKNPTEWIGFLPSWISGLSVSATTFIYFNAGFEIIFGFLLLIGQFTRLSAFLLGLHLLGIAFSIGYNPLGIRDLILAIATFSVFLRGADAFCYERNRND